MFGRKITAMIPASILIGTLTNMKHEQKIFEEAVRRHWPVVPLDKDRQGKYLDVGALWMYVGWSLVTRADLDPGKPPVVPDGSKRSASLKRK